MKKIFFLIALSYFTSSSAQSLDSFFKDSDDFFKIYVKDGRVNYKAIKENPSALNSVLSNAKAIKIQESEATNYQAFWINAYNLLVIKSVIDSYPIKSPLDVKGFFDKKAHDVGGKSITLNAIENKLLRAKFKDPRFHFVLVCGAVGCPPLISGAYLPERLDTQLTTQTKSAINGHFIKINNKKKRVQVSQIMEWYKEDFILEGTEIDFLNQYLLHPLPEKFKISYIPYNWELNIY